MLALLHACIVSMSDPPCDVFPIALKTSVIQKETKQLVVDIKRQMAKDSDLTPLSNKMRQMELNLEKLKDVAELRGDDIAVQVGTIAG